MTSQVSRVLFAPMVETMQELALQHEVLESPQILTVPDTKSTHGWQKFFRGAIAAALLAVGGAVQAGETNVPKPVPASSVAEKTGALVVGGGGNLPDAVHMRFIELAGGKDARIVVIPTASLRADDPEQSIDMYWKWKDSVASAQLLHTRNRLQANLPEFVKPLKEATGVWLGGGWQHRLTDAYNKTIVLDEIHNIYQRGGVIGGSSAGAAVMSSVMVKSNGQNGAPELCEGFGLIPNSVVDQHFLKRRRGWRLEGALGIHPNCMGLGVDEDTAAILQGNLSSNPKISVIGPSEVLFFHPKLNKRFTLRDGEIVDLLSLTEPPKSTIETETMAETDMAGMK